MAALQAELRAFALSLPGAGEHFPWGERVVKVNGKIFVFLGHDEETGPPLMTVKLGRPIRVIKSRAQELHIALPGEDKNTKRWVG